MSASPGRALVRQSILAAEDASAALLREAFDQFPQPLRHGLAVAVSGVLERLAAEHGDWRAWAWAQHYLPYTHHDVAAEELIRLLTPRRTAKPPAPRQRRNPDRARLARMAVELVRAGHPGRAILARLDTENAALPSPLPPAAIGSIAVWAARKVTGVEHG